MGSWQAEDLCAVSGFPREKIYLLKNGIHLPDFVADEKRAANRLIYTSTPFRGLTYLPTILKELRKKHADLEWHVFSGYQVYAGPDGHFDPTAEKQFADITQRLSQAPGIVLHGNVKQSELAREFLKSTILAYPNSHKETSCITAMEAQAAGCPIVTSALAALPETVGNAGLLIRGIPGSSQYLRDFIIAVDRLLSDATLYKTLSENGRQRAQEFSWTTIATHFETYLRKVLGLT